MLTQQEVPQGAALAFLLAAPAVNPIVLVATAVAFPGQPEIVLARFVGSLLTAILVGWLWAKIDRVEWIAERALRKFDTDPGASRWSVFKEIARHDLIGSGGFLVLGGLTAAVFNVVVPQSWLQTLGGHVVLAIVVMALLAVILALCSQADAALRSAASECRTGK
jgi:uncharacterized membrane protein YraQ (UPF0718 family)